MTHQSYSLEELEQYQRTAPTPTGWHHARMTILPQPIRREELCIIICALNELSYDQDLSVDRDYYGREARLISQ